VAKPLGRSFVKTLLTGIIKLGKDEWNLGFCASGLKVRRLVDSLGWVKQMLGWAGCLAKFFPATAIHRTSFLFLLCKKKI